jgi:hypothetical protein
MIKNRNRSRPTTPRNMSNNVIEKFRNNAGIIARMGMIRDAIYRLLAQNRPSARLEKFFRSPALTIFFERRFSPDMQSESGAR